MKKLLLITLFVSTLLGDILDDKIKSLIDSPTYLRHQRLIGVIFRERKNFVKGSNIDYIKVVESLKNNGLLRIFYKKPRELTLNFDTTIAPKIFIKSVTDILRELGYNLYLTKEMKKTQSSLKWKINYNSDHALDPFLFAKKLQKYHMEIHNLAKKGNTWEYNIGSRGVSLGDSQKIRKIDQQYSLLKPDGEYWLELGVSAAHVAIERKASGYWYPKVVFYDKNLKILKVFKRDNSRKKVLLAIPKKGRFIKIIDQYSSEGLKKGVIVSTLHKR